MFVRIIWLDTMQEVTYDCKKVAYTPAVLSEEKEYVGIIVMEQAGQGEGDRTLEFSKDDEAEILYMNCSGRTVDRKIYQRDRALAIKRLEDNKIKGKK